MSENKGIGKSESAPVMFGELSVSLKDFPKSAKLDNGKFSPLFILWICTLYHCSPERKTADDIALAWNSLTGDNLPSAQIRKLLVKHAGYVPDPVLSGKGKRGAEVRNEIYGNIKHEKVKRPGNGKSLTASPNDISEGNPPAVNSTGDVIRFSPDHEEVIITASRAEYVITSASPMKVSVTPLSLVSAETGKNPECAPESSDGTASGNDE